MSLVKKIVFLLIFFLLVNIFSLYNFDYKSYLNDNTNLASPYKENDNFTFSTILSSIKGKFSSFSSEDVGRESSSIVLVKKDGVIELNGLFKNEKEAKLISDLFGVNREGDINFDGNRVLNEALLNKISILIPTFKDLFADNSKLSIINNEVSLDGELKDSNYKGLFDSVISKIDFKLSTNVILPDTIVTSVIEQPLPSSIEKTTTEPISVQEVKINKVINNQELQQTINEILKDNKITFERRGTKVVDTSILTIEKIAKLLKNNPKLKVEVSGHTDSRGKSSLNKQISQERASRVREILINFGVDGNRITAVGYGNERPIAQDDENGLSEINRRVEFNILGE